MVTNIRNVAIIAHVDHGKTTLVDKLLTHSGLFRSNEVVVERMMDSMDLEKEKGITIRAKNASIVWKDTKINIVDTPGHADFGGEVERILKMVDGVLLIVDAAEGPQAQTRFVLRKALENGLKLIVVINKIDREFANPTEVHDRVLELLLDLHANEEQFNAPFIYGSAKNGYMHETLESPRCGMELLLNKIVDVIPPPVADTTKPFKMLISNLDWSDYVGRIAIGKVLNGVARPGDRTTLVDQTGPIETKAITKIFTFSGLRSTELDGVAAGDIAGIAGFDKVHIGECFCDEADLTPIPFVHLDPPTLRMQLVVNDSPLCGRDGKFLTARHLKERLVKETRTNISLELAESGMANAFTINARGVLQVAILVETMRREGFEMLVAKPEVIFQTDNGHKTEPFETLWLEVPEDCLGDAIQNLAMRKAQIEKMEHGSRMVRIEALIPTRGLIGLETFLANKTAGQAVTSHMFAKYAPYCGPISTRVSGVLVSMENGVSTAYALTALQDRGKLFIGPQEEVYVGMIVGENSRPDDLTVNPTKAKQLTNFRSQGEGRTTPLEPPVQMSLEKAIEFIAPDEYVEVTPNFLRLRKKILDATQRKRAA